jgi:hypothetical protein
MSETEHSKVIAIPASKAAHGKASLIKGWDGGMDVKWYQVKRLITKPISRML